MDAAEATTNPARHAVPPTHESVGGVAAALWRKKFWIIIPTVLAFCLSMLVVNLLGTRYTGEARVLLENRETVYSRADKDAGGQSLSIDPEAVASQVQNVMSKDLATKVINEMGLAKRAEYDPAQKGVGISGSVLIALGLMKDPRTIPQEERVLEMYFKRLLAYPLGKSRVIAIEFQSEDPQVAANVANRIAEEYLTREEGAKNQTSKVTSDWLDKAIDPLMKKVITAEGKVEAFRAAKGLFMGANNTTISTQQLSELNTQLSQSRAQQADLQARSKLIREALKHGRVFETSEVINNDLVRRLLEQRAQLKAQIAFDERTLLPGHPRMKELGSQLADLESQVRSAAERAARAFENDARAAAARVTSMQAELDSQKKTAKLSNEDEVQLKALEREASALREQLNSYRNKFLDAAARSNESAQPADARVISRAFPQSDPTFPKKIPIVLLATLGTLVLCSALIATQALMARQALPAYADAGFGYDYPAMAPEQVSAQHAAAPMPWETQKTGWGGFSLPFGLGKKGRSAEATRNWPPAEPYTGHPMQTEASAADDLARELALLDFNGQGKVILVFGLEQDARTGLSAVRFARRLAEDGASIVVDLVGQGFAARAGGNLYSRMLSPGALGLNAWLDRVASLGDVIHRDSRTRLHVVPAGEPLHHRIGSITTREELTTLIEALRRTYSHVIVDGGAIGGAGEFFASIADAVVLLSRRGEEDPFMRRTVERLEALRDAPVYVMADAAGTEYAAANDAYPAGFAGNG
ncbi:MAG: lipopolysaccharide biosynthesis [Beijerinckiaceae bacterium]|nr:MAG: lipopolysaccharide biosynthesis [Beijerinckiaceae bacterium]